MFPRITFLAVPKNVIISHVYCVFHQSIDGKMDKFSEGSYWLNPLHRAVQLYNFLMYLLLY
jgi:hypothetical protein